MSDGYAVIQFAYDERCPDDEADEGSPSVVEQSQWKGIASDIFGSGKWNRGDSVVYPL